MYPVSWCWFHKIANVLNALSKSAQPGAKTALAEIWNAVDKGHALAAGTSSRVVLERKAPMG